MISIIALSVLLAGCSECKIDSDCLGKACHDTSCTEKKCVQTPVPNCCGNQKCDLNENACSCPSDCGKCEGKQGKYLEKVCQNEECVVGVDKYKVEELSLTHSKDVLGFEVNALVQLGQPFDTSTSAAFFEAEMTDRKENVIEAKLVKVQIVAKSAQREIVLGEKDFNRVFYGIGAKINGNINLNQGLQGSEQELPALVRVFYEYTEKIGTERRVKRSSYDSSLGSKLVFVKTTTKYTCDSAKDCNDNNDCTIDSCIDGTLLCSQELIPACCGNYQCEADENRAVCPNDCGPCFGSAGSYLEYKQQKNECLLVFKQGVVQPVTLSKTKALTNFKLTIKSTFNQPLGIATDNINMEVLLDDYDPAKVQLPISITRIQLLDGKTIVAEHEEDLRILGLGRKAEAAIPVILGIDGVEEQRDIQMKIHYSYNEIKATNQVELKTGIIDDILKEDMMFAKTS